MKRIIKTITFFLTLLLFTQLAFTAQAKGENKKPDQLTQEQMKHAIVVPDGATEHRSKGKGQVYRFASCDDTGADAPCYSLVTDSNSDTST